MKNTILYSGTIGSAPWTLDERGTLTIGASVEPTSQDLKSPWWEYSHKILRIVGKSPFVAVGSYYRWFGDLPYVKSIDLSGWDTSLVTDMSEMFVNCANLETLNLSGWDISSVTDMEEMFAYCYKLETLNLSQWNPSSVTNMKGMFSGCHNLKNLNLSMWDTSSVTDMSRMFGGCYNLKTLDISTWDTSAVTNMKSIFGGCHHLETLDLSNWNTSSVIDMSEMFGKYPAYNVRKYPLESDFPKGCYSLKSLNLSRWDTSSVTDMSGMFSGCHSLEELDISTWNTSYVKDMWKMFEGCWNLESLDLSTWDTSSTKNMEGMFEDCSRLKILDISRWDTSSVIEMSKMFANCVSLETLNISTWNISRVKNMGKIFIGCKNLKFLDISTWNLISVNKGMMFAFCENLEIVMVLESYKELKDSFKQKNSNSFLQLEFGLNQDDWEYIQTNENPFSSRKDSSHLNTFLVRKDRLIHSIDLSSQKYVLKLNERKEISYSLEPIYPLFPSLSWKSKDSSVVSVNQEGFLEAHKPGKTTIIVSSINEVSAEFQVEVLEEERKTNSSSASNPSFTFSNDLTTLTEVIQNIKEIGLLYEKGILDEKEFNQLKNNLFSLLKE